jgi:hypothetical protein
MKKLHLFSVILLISLITGCSPSTKILGSWTSPSKPAGGYNNIFVTAITENLLARQEVENDIDEILKREGINAASSFEIIPPGFVPSAATKDKIINAIKAKGHDAALTVALLDQTTETRYVPGTAMYSPMVYGGAYRSFYGYYSYYSPAMYTPGYYESDKKYYIEMNLYDLSTEELVWSSQSETTNPSSVEGFAEAFSQTVVGQLIKDGLIVKK